MIVQSGVKFALLKQCKLRKSCRLNLFLASPKMSAKTRGGEKHGQRKCSFNSSNVNGPGTLPAFHSRSASPIISSKYLVGLYGTEKEISLSLANWRRKALIMVPSGKPSSSAASCASRFMALSVFMLNIVFICAKVYTMV